MPLATPIESFTAVLLQLNVRYKTRVAVKLAGAEGSVPLFRTWYGKDDPDEDQYDFLENRAIDGRLELPKIFYTLFNVRSVLSSPILRHDRALGLRPARHRRQAPARSLAHPAAHWRAAGVECAAQPR